jgi:hypothetical protein
VTTLQIPAEQVMLALGTLAAVLPVEDPSLGCDVVVGSEGRGGDVVGERERELTALGARDSWRDGWRQGRRHVRARRRRWQRERERERWVGGHREKEEKNGSTFITSGSG